MSRLIHDSTVMSRIVRAFILSPNEGMKRDFVSDRSLSFT
jgi:hypothetical protein